MYINQDSLILIWKLNMTIWNIVNDCQRFGALPQKSFDIEIVAMFLGCLKRHLVEVERW